MYLCFPDEIQTEDRGWKTEAESRQLEVCIEKHTFLFFGILTSDFQLMINIRKF